MRIDLSNTTDLIAAVPALLGFVPHDSLVLVTSTTRQDGLVTLGPCVRAELADVERDPGGIIAHCADTVISLQVTGVIGVIVGTTTNSTSTHALPLRDAADAAAAALHAHGLTLIELVHVPEIAENARWHSYRDPAATGVLPDPHISVTAVAALAATGESVAPSRDDLVSRYTPTRAPADERARLSPLIDTALATAGADQHDVHAARARLARADTAIHQAHCGRLPAHDATVVDLVATFTTRHFREAVLAVATSPANTAAEHLARHLWRVTPDSHSDSLLAVIAALAYSRGHLIAAHITLDTADTTALPLLTLLHQCLHAHIPPTDIGPTIARAGRHERHALTNPADDRTPPPQH